jgi:hypothetical protein
LKIRLLTRAAQDGGYMLAAACRLACLVLQLPLESVSGGQARRTALVQMFRGDGEIPGETCQSWSEFIGELSVKGLRRYRAEGAQTLQKPG